VISESHTWFKRLIASPLIRLGYLGETVTAIGGLHPPAPHPAEQDGAAFAAHYLFDYLPLEF